MPTESRNAVPQLSSWLLICSLGFLVNGCGARAKRTPTPEGVLKNKQSLAAPRSPKEALPMFSCWNTGQHGKGWTPFIQRTYLAQHPGWLPWFELYSDLIPRSPSEPYYRNAWSYVKDRQLPVHFVFDNVADTFRTFEGPGDWSEADEEDEHPWLIKKDGSIVKRASPLGSIEPWYALGRVFGKAMKPFAASYTPPYVLLSDNNEAGFVSSNELLEDYRLDPSLLANAQQPEEMEALRSVLREGFGVRYQRFKQGIEDEIPLWKGRIYTMGYGSFGQKFGITDFYPDPFRYSVPWVSDSGRGKEEITHDGVWSNAGYLSYRKHNQVMSGTVESCNLHFAWHHFEKEHHPVIRGQIFWQADAQGLNQKNWFGHVRCSLWMAKPEQVMYFMPSAHSLDKGESWFFPFRAAVFEIHDNPILRRHWMQGDLRESPEGHPYQEMLPTAYQDPVKHRWFPLEVPLNQRFTESGDDRWQKDRTRTQRVKAWAFLSEWTAEGGEVERLLFACATMETLKDVAVQIEGFGDVRIPVVLETGDFWLLNQDGSLNRIESPLDDFQWE